MRNLRSASTSQLLMAPAVSAGLSLGVLGLLESLYVASFSPSVMWYGFGLYALVGAASGLLWGLLFGGNARRREFGVIWLAGQAAAVPVFALALAAAGFMVWRDLWAESISGAGIGGWLAMLAVPVGAALLAVLARKVTRGLVARAYSVAAVVLVLALAGVLLGRVIESSGVDAPEAGRSYKGGTRTPVVFVVADAMRADAMGVYGAPEDATPNIDAFAKDAVVFTEAWTPSTWTRPAVASILTGQYPAVHKTMYKSDRLPASLPTLAGMLRGYGYATVASVTNVNLTPAFGLGRGFDAWGYLAPRPHLLAPVSARRMFLVEIYRLLRLRFFPGLREVGSYYAEGERVGRQARELMGPLAKSGRPFFAYLHYMEPHDPFFAHPYDGHAIARVENPNPPRELAPQMLDLYRQEVRHFDELFGELLSWLKDVGLYDRALIVVTADHGEEFADHGHFWHGTSLYRELVRVPLVVRFPGGAGAGTRRDEPVSLVDLAPTALVAAGLEPAVDLPGRVLTAQQPVAAVRPLFAELDHQGCVLSAVRVGAWKLILANPDNPRKMAVVELFDLADDPAESRNRTASESGRIMQLRAVLDAGPRASGLSVRPEQVDVDAATEEQLRSLGYTQ